MKKLLKRIRLFFTSTKKRQEKLDGLLILKKHYSKSMNLVDNSRSSYVGLCYLIELLEKEERLNLTQANYIRVRIQKSIKKQGVIYTPFRGLIKINKRNPAPGFLFPTYEFEPRKKWLWEEIKRLINH